MFRGQRRGSSAASSTLTIQTVVASLASIRTLEGSRPLLAVIGLIFLVTRKRRRLALLCVILMASLAGMASLTGCGYTPRTATYNVNITGTSGSYRHQRKPHAEHNRDPRPA